MGRTVTILAALLLLSSQAKSQSVAWTGSNYESSYVEVHGAKMHYVDTGGDGDPIVLVHGIPSWSYLWRNVVPHLEDRGRVIAVDLIGFGRSDKPDAENTLAVQTKHFDRFIDSLGLKEITLVVHDMGSFVGLNYAMNHQDKIKAIVCMESMLLQDTWENMEPEAADYMKRIREEPEFLVEMTVNQDSAANMLQYMTLRELDQSELDAYREPFKTKKQRRTLMSLWVDFPISGSPKASHDVQAAYLRGLTRSSHPKLILTISHAVVGHQRQVDWIRTNLSNVDIQPVGKGGHFMQEDQPDAIGKAINAWMQKRGL